MAKQKIGNIQYEFDPEKDKIDEGGSSEVFRAKVPGTENSFVALKILKREGSVERLKLEKRVMDALTDPDVPDSRFPRMHGFSLDSDRPFIAMDYVPSSLRKFIEDSNNRYQFDTIFKIAGQILEALEVAHDRGYVHRDLKPENVLLDKNYNVKLTDFSLVKVLDEIEEKEADRLKNSLDMTKDIKFSMIGGTIGYMSPEQQRGESADERSDIFSFGKLLYEMFTGRVPEGKFRPLHKFDRNIPEWVDNIVDKCMANEPENRFQSIRDIRRYMADGLEGKFDVPKTSALKEFGAGLLKTGWNALKWGTSPVWGVPYLCFRASYDACDDTGTILGIVGGAAYIAVVDIAVPLFVYSAVGDSQLREELKKANLEGKIACVEENRIYLFNARDVTKEGIDAKTINVLPMLKEIKSMKFSEDGQLYVLGGLYKNEDELFYCLFSVDIDSGRSKMLVEDLYPKLNGTPEDVFVSKKEKVIIKNKDGHLYEFDPETKKIREIGDFERGVDQHTIEGKYAFDTAEESQNKKKKSKQLQVERNSWAFGSINTTIKTSDYKKTIYRAFKPNKRVDKPFMRQKMPGKR